jgi:hypothetical protein
MTIDPDLVRLVDRFLQSKYYVKVHVARNWSDDATPIPPPPHEMLCGPPDANGFAEWRPVDSPVDEEMVAGFERFLGTQLPPLFKSYLMYKCLLINDLNFVILPELDPRHPLGWLEWSVKASRCIEIRARPWYVPFTCSPAQIGFLCFDTRRPDEVGDYPIMEVFNSGTINSPALIFTEVYCGFRSYINFAYNYLEWSKYLKENTSNTKTLAAWLEDQGRPVPNAVRHYQPWSY